MSINSHIEQKQFLTSIKGCNSVANKNIIMSSFKSSRNIQKKEYGPDRSVSDNQSSSVTLNELAVKAKFAKNDNLQ